MKARDTKSLPKAAFMALLVEDVIAARARLIASQAQTARRDVVRASMAAVEGMTWVAREHVRSALATCGELTPVAEMALRETAYMVAENGKLIEQARWLPLTTAIRLTVSLAQLVNPAILVDFTESGWSNLRRAIEIRNRITHPKPDQDLAISDKDLAIVGSGMFWVLATVEYVMASMNLVLVQHKDLLREIVQRLTAGDPEALAEYHAMLQESRGGD